MALIDNLIAYWKLDEASGTTAEDIHGSFDMTHDASPNVTGKLNTGYDFDTIDEGTTASINLTGDKSISLWVYPNSNSYSPAAHPFHTGSGNAAEAFGVFVNGADIYLWGGSGMDYDTGENLGTGAWEHWVITYKESTTTFRFYRNGAIKKEQSADLNTTNTKLTINSRTDTANRGLDATFDEIGVWNKELTSDEVAALYNSGAGFAYPFAVSATVTPATLTLSTTNSEPVYKIAATTLTFSTSLNLSNAIYLIENRLALRKTIGTRYLNKHYVDVPYILKNGVARDVGYYGS